MKFYFGKSALHIEQQPIVKIGWIIDALFIENDRDEIIDVNDKACTLLGYTREELLAMTVADIQAPECRGDVGTVLCRELRDYQGKPFEAVDLHKSGTRIPVEVTNTRLDEKGLVLSIVREYTLADFYRLEEGKLARDESIMAKIAHELLTDIDKETVDFVPNYDESETEPAVFPTRIPNLLVNGSAGIAVGISGSSAIGGITEKPEIFGRALVFVGLAEGIAIYGLIISFFLLTQ